MLGIYILMQEYDFVEQGTNVIRSLDPGAIGIPDPSDQNFYLFNGFRIARSLVTGNPNYFSPMQGQSFWSPPNDGDTVWQIDGTDVISITFDVDDEEHLARYSVGDIWSTEQEAVAEIQRRYLLQRLRELAQGLNLGWVPNWGDPGQSKYYIAFKNNLYTVQSTTDLMIPGVVYFRSGVIAEQAIGLLGGLIDNIFESWGGSFGGSSVSC